MTEKQTKNQSKVVRLKAKPDNRKASERKFGKPVMEIGFCIVPSLLIQAQARLGLEPQQINILLHLLDMWWDKDSKPFPTKELIAERMGVSDKTVQRHIAAMEKAGLVRRIERTKPGRGRTSNEYDLSGLVAKLKELEPDFAIVKAANIRNRRNAALPKFRRKG
ncbi:MAG: helix-turn-helix domain-containing protein [Pseudomonadota bacterium]